MFSLIFVVICLSFIALGHYGPKYLKKLQDTLEEKEYEERSYKERTLRALERMASSVPDPDAEPHQPSKLESFLEGNRKILEKQKVRRAIKEELDID
jgi:hypothetical protein